MRRSIVVGVALLVLAVFFVGGPSLLFSPSTDGVASDETEVSPRMTTVEDSESSFWRYLSPEERFQQRSPINVVVRGSSDDVERVLIEASDGDWSEINESEVEAGPETYTLTGAENTTDNETDAADLPTRNDSATDGEPENASVDESVNASDANATDGEFENATDANVSADESANESENASADESANESENASSESSGPIPDLEWGEADGGTRYAYVDPGEGEDGYWTTETRQLEDGDYYGQRYHIRLYESPNEDDQWVAMQTHSEHFDWFTLQHRVHGSQAAQTKVETDFMSHPRIDVEEDVHRMYLDNRNAADADGWATVVDLTGMVVLPAGAGLVARRRGASADVGIDGRTDPDRVSEHAPDVIDDHLTDVDRRRIAAAYDRIEAGHLVLVFAVLALFLGVRMGGLVLERRAGFLTPHQIAALLYPVIALGIPIATYAISGTLTRRLDAALVAAGSLAAAIWIDYGLVGVESLPVDVVLQRMLVVVALGLIAAGAAKRATRDSRLNDMLLAGVAMWVVVLAGTLLGYF